MTDHYVDDETGKMHRIEASTESGLSDSTALVSRHAGNTFRRVLRGLADASEGKHIILVSNTRPHADVAIRMMRTFAGSVLHVLHHKPRVDFPSETGGGSFAVLTESEYQHKNKNGCLRGCPFEVVFDG